MDLDGDLFTAVSEITHSFTNPYIVYGGRVRSERIRTVTYALLCPKSLTRSLIPI